MAMRAIAERLPALPFFSASSINSVDTAEASVAPAES